MKHFLIPFYVNDLCSFYVLIPTILDLQILLLLEKGALLHPSGSVVVMQEGISLSCQKLRVQMRGA